MEKTANAMTVSIKAVIYGIVGITVACLILIHLYFSAPDTLQASGAEIAKTVSERKNTPVDALNVKTAHSPTENRALTGSDETALAANDNEPDANQFNSFAAHMSVSGAMAETYVMVDGALQTNRLEEFAKPEQFDAFAASLERNADAESYEKAAEYMKGFYSMVNDSGSTVTVSTVACGVSVCIARFQSPNTKDIDQYLANLQLSEALPMYATMEMPAESNGGYDIRRILFTIDPAASAFEVLVSP